MKSFSFGYDMSFCGLVLNRGIGGQLESDVKIFRLSYMPFLYGPICNLPICEETFHKRNEWIVSLLWLLDHPTCSFRIFPPK